MGLLDGKKAEVEKDESEVEREEPQVVKEKKPDLVKSIKKFL